jgi:hypothetical protein
MKVCGRREIRPLPSNLPLIDNAVRSCTISFEVKVEEETWRRLRRRRGRGTAASRAGNSDGGGRRHGGRKGEEGEPKRQALMMRTMRLVSLQRGGGRGD